MLKGFSIKGLGGVLELLKIDKMSYELSFIINPEAVRIISRNSSEVHMAESLHQDKVPSPVDKSGQSPVIGIVGSLLTTQI